MFITSVSFEINEIFKAILESQMFGWYVLYIRLSDIYAVATFVYKRC